MLTRFLFVDLVPNSDEASAAVGHQRSDELSLSLLISFALSFPNASLFVVTTLRAVL
jgi:hypothetical protein